MEIVAFEPEMAVGVARCYNELIEPVPDCHPVGAQRFATMDGLRHRGVRDEAIGVAVEDRHVVGFAHVGVALPAEDGAAPKGEPGVIRFLSYPVGKRAVGQALLEWAERQITDRKRSRVVAFEGEIRYPFYHFGYAHLSERIGHVRGLLGMNGYREDRAELYLTWPQFVPPDPGTPGVEFEIRTQWDTGPIGPRLEVHAYQGDARVGTCRMQRGQFSPGPDAQDWCYCSWLGVDDALQGKRLGRFLIASALKEMQRAGCVHAAISTAADNYRGQLLYTNLGYRVTDSTVVLSKDMTKR